MMKMKKAHLLYFVWIITIVGCNNANNVGPFPEDKVVCKENVDTILSHLKGWNVIDSVFTIDNFYSTSNKEGERTEFRKYVLVARITDGMDTLTITADDSKTCFNMNTYKDEEAWSGRVFGLVMDFDKNINAIKRNNLAIKRACSNDSCFELSTNDDKIMSAEFRKWKPKSPERPLEDYGLTKDDI